MQAHRGQIRSLPELLQLKGLEVGLVLLLLTTTDAATTSVGTSSGAWYPTLPGVMLLHPTSVGGLVGVFVLRLRWLGCEVQLPMEVLFGLEP
jgi:hypothetical protein